MTEQTVATEEILIVNADAPTAPAKRFVRNKDVPKEKLMLRERMVSARVMNGMTAVEAAKRLGYKNSSQLSLIENGERKVPDDWKFLLTMARVYSVSVDYLLGLSPHPERDAVAAESFAMLRGFEELQRAQALAMTAAFMQYGRTRELAKTDLRRIEFAAREVIASLTRVRELNPDLFQELRAGTKLLAAVEALESAVIPVAETNARRIKVEQHCMAIAKGEAGPLASAVPDAPQMALDI